MSRGKRSNVRPAKGFITFSQKFNKVNNTAQILDSIYQLTLKIHLKLRLWHKNVENLSLYTQCCYRGHHIMLLNM